MLRGRFVLVLIALLVGGVTGCASTRLVNAWQDPKFTGPPLHTIMVLRVTNQASVRRTFEDELVRQLQARGVQAVASYTLIPEDGEVPKERLAEAVKASDVQGVLITRLVKVDRQTQVYPGSYPPGPYMGFYGYYSGAWVGAYDPGQVYTYDVVTVETSLFDAKADKLIWAGTTESFAPRDMKKDTQEFGGVVIDSLLAAKLI